MPFTRSQAKAQMESPSPSPSSSPFPMDVSPDEPNTIQDYETQSFEDINYWEHNGTNYLKDSEGFLYDTITGENIGYFDGERVMDTVEDGIWVEHSSKTEIIPSSFAEKKYTESELLDNYRDWVRQLEKEISNKDDKISQQFLELKNRAKDIEQHENIRQALIKRRDHWMSEYNIINSKYSDLEDIQKAIESGADTAASVLESSGAFDESEKVMTNDQLKLEVARKEKVIIRKDAKATRLINIIREKNVEIGNLKTSLESYQNYSWMLSTNVSNLSDRIMQWQNYYNQMSSNLTHPSACSDTAVDIPTSGGELQYVNQTNSIVNETDLVGGVAQLWENGDVY